MSGLDDDSRNALVEYRLERAYKTLVFGRAIHSELNGLEMVQKRRN